MSEFTPEEKEEAYMQNASNVIKDFANYGGNLLVAVGDPKYQLEQHFRIVVLAHLRHCMEILDSISCLFLNRVMLPCKMLLRGLFESYAGFSYLIKKDPVIRSQAYFYYSKFKEKERLETLSSSPYEENLLHDKLLHKQPPLNISNDIYYEQLKVTLKSEKFRNIAEDYASLFKKNRNTYWYSIFNGPGNFRKLCEKVDLPASYTLFYGSLSKPVHGNSLVKYYIFPNDDNTVSVPHLRSSAIGASENFSMSYTLGLLFYKEILENVLKDKYMNENFVEWWGTIIKPRI